MYRTGNYYKRIYSYFLFKNDYVIDITDACRHVSICKISSGQLRAAISFNFRLLLGLFLLEVVHELALVASMHDSLSSWR